MLNAEVDPEPVKGTTRTTAKECMAGALDGARLKVVRAQEHLDALKTEVRAYLDGHPYQIVLQGAGDCLSASAAVRVAPPIRLSAIIGDCVTNARAALDHIAWQLAVRHLDRPPFSDMDDRRWVSFPLTIDPNADGYVNKINRFANRQIPASAISIIKSVQPYNAGQQPLWYLHELVNCDKHRLPLLTIGVVHGIRHLTLFGVDAVSGDRKMLGGASSIQSMSINTAMADLRPAVDVEVDAQVSGFVAFADLSMPREPVDRTLEQIIKAVTDVIPRFDRFF